MVREEVKIALSEMEISTPHEEKMEVPRETENSEPEWITQSEIVRMLPDSILLHTRKSKVSKAVASGKLITNGLVKYECRVQKKSAEAWIAEVTS